MRRFEVVFRPRAVDDLVALHDSIAERAGLEVAGAYVEPIEAACRALETFPRRGARRDKIRPGLRTMGFERRATIVFRVMKAEVLIIRIFHGGQDYERALRGLPET